MPRRVVAFAVLAMLPLLAGAQTGAAPPRYGIGDRLESPKSAKGPAKAAGRYREVKWEELVSPAWNPDAIIKSLNLDTMMDGDPRAVTALEQLRQEWERAPANPTLDGAEVRLSGFVVPLEREGSALREFLLVPYFGACIHVPPPPANQIVHVVTARAIPNTSTMDAVTVSGKLALFQVQTHLGRSGYRLQAAQVEPYSRNP